MPTLRLALQEVHQHRADAVCTLIFVGITERLRRAVMDDLTGLRCDRQDNICGVTIIAGDFD